MTPRTPTLLPCLLAALLATACATAPLAPVPAPLPEALAWPEPPAEGAFLGVEGEENSGDSLDSLSFEPGVRVVRVVENSPADRAGVQGGDVILALDDREVDDPDALESLVQRAGPGREVRLDVLRGDTVTEVPLVLDRTAGAASRPPRMRYRLDPSRSRAGWATVADGVLLVSSPPDGPFPRDGVPVGSVVLGLEDTDVASDREFIRRLQALEPGKRVTVRVRLPDGQVVGRRVRLFDTGRRVTGWGMPILMNWKAEADGSSAKFSFIDLWILEIFQYRRDQGERTWVFLELFGWELFPFSTGVGELE